MYIGSRNHWNLSLGILHRHGIIRLCLLSSPFDHHWYAKAMQFTFCSNIPCPVSYASDLGHVAITLKSANRQSMFTVMKFDDDLVYYSLTSYNSFFSKWPIQCPMHIYGVLTDKDRIVEFTSHHSLPIRHSGVRGLDSSTNTMKWNDPCEGFCFWNN